MIFVFLFRIPLFYLYTLQIFLFFSAFFLPLPRKIILNDPVAEAPGRAVGFEEMAGGHFVEEMDEAQGQHPGTVELPTQQPVLEDGKVERLGGGGEALVGGGDLEEYATLKIQ